jgi:hypothetical protein
MTQTTLDTLFEREVLVPGDTLVVNKRKLRTKTPVTEEMLRDRNELELWRCQITKDTRETHRVRYLHDDDHYGLASLATHIVEQLVENSAYVNITSQGNYWRHTAFGNRTLWDLAINRVPPDRRSSDV